MFSCKHRSKTIMSRKAVFHIMSALSFLLFLLPLLKLFYWPYANFYHKYFLSYKIKTIILILTCCNYKQVLNSNVKQRDYVLYTYCYTFVICIIINTTLPQSHQIIVCGPITNLELQFVPWSTTGRLHSLD